MVHESELRVLEVLWEKGPRSASDIARDLKDATGWSRNTTYTVIKRCVGKGLIRRDDPKFICTPLVTRDEVRSSAADDLIDRMYDGSRSRFFAALIDDSRLSADELSELRRLIEEKERGNDS